MGEMTTDHEKRMLIVEDEPAIADNIAFAVEAENMTPIRAESERLHDLVERVLALAAI